MKKFFIKNLFPLLLITITVILCIANYVPGTFLSGWDTLHPEFNFPEYFKRILFGVWQQYQGLGALSSQTHPAELSKMLIYYPFSFILPISFLRYAYFFLTLILASLGTYYFIKTILLKEDSLQNKIASFAGGLFYLLNLGTVQHYFVPLEMFATHFATLPWLFLFLVKYIQKPNAKNLIIFALITFFSTSIAHTSTLWFAYFLSLIAFLFIYNLLNRSKRVLISSLKIIAITLLINSFWLLPNLYFIIHNGRVVAQSKINFLFSEEAFVNNKLFGAIPDILIFKNFLFNWNAYVDDGKFGPLLQVWINHLQQPAVLIIGYGLSLIAMFGLVYSAVKKNIIALSLLAIFAISIFFLLTDNLPFGFLFHFFQNSIPFFREAFRFPFTKFSILLMFVFSCYFAFGIKFLIKRLSPYFFIVIFIAFIYYMLPAFQGNLISPLMKVNIPSDYFSVFNLLNSKPYGRIATLPIHSFWAWNYYSWGYQGAGFLWFGLKDPVLEREFDRWNPANEQYYREMSQAIYSQDQTKLNNVLAKYDISYILWDKSVIAPDQSRDKKILFQPETEKLLENDPNVQLIANFGDLFIYETSFQRPAVRIITNSVSVGHSASAFYDDFAYTKYHDYITYGDLPKNTAIYPFRNISDNQNRLININLLSSASEIKTFDVTANVQTTNDCIQANFKEKIKSQKTIAKDASGRFIEYSSSSGSFCEHFSYPTLPRSSAYLISIDARNVQGLPLRICISNYISQRCDLFTHLSSSKEFAQNTFLIPPVDQSVGFDININNFSVKNNPSVNDIRSIKIFSFDYNKLSQTETYNPSAENGEKSVLVYSQAFDSGWKAYQTNFQFSILNFQLENAFPFLFGKELKEHVLVNNWANGWILNNSQLSTLNSQLVIIFWPQYLEYLGFAILIVTFAWLIIRLRKT